jgi:hypothetical protein
MPEGLIQATKHHRRSSGLNTEVVEFLKDFKHEHREFPSGTRCLAWQGLDGWNVIFNGSQIPVPRGIVGKIDSPAVLRAVESRASAREEEYQTAKP